MKSLQENPIIMVDFDGTVVEHEYPHIGKSIGAEEWLRQWVANGALLILFTMRDKRHLAEASEWFEKHGIALWCIQRNPNQAAWTCSPKPYAKLYLDDHGYGVPLIFPKDGRRPYVDWSTVGPKVLEMLDRNKK